MGLHTEAAAPPEPEASDPLAVRRAAFHFFLSSASARERLNAQSHTDRRDQAVPPPQNVLFGYTLKRPKRGTRVHGYCTVVL